MPDNGLVSVIVLTWNRKEDTLNTLNKLKSSRYDKLEVIVVDNGSDDGTKESIPVKHPDIKYLYLPENTGIAGYNRGMELATGEFIVFLDSDSYPDPDAIKKMVRAFEVQVDVGAIAFDVRSTEREEIDAARRKTEFDPSGGMEASSYNGAGVGIRRECIKKAGDLFEPLFLYFNEFDHSFRIWNSGYRIVHFPDIIAYHKTSATGRTSSRTAYYYTRNMIWIIWRYYPYEKMILTLFIFFFWAAIFSFFHKTTIYLKATLDAFKGLPEISNNRILLSSEISKKIRLPLKWAFMSYG